MPMSRGTRLLVDVCDRILQDVGQRPFGSVTLQLNIARIGGVDQRTRQKYVHELVAMGLIKPHVTEAGVSMFVLNDDRINEFRE